jgi:hypothetical protein
MAEPGGLELLFGAVTEALAPLVEAANVTPPGSGVVSLARELGIDLSSLDAATWQEFAQAICSAIDDLEVLVDGSEDGSPLAILGGPEHIRRFVSAIEALDAALPAPANLGARMFDYLVYEYVRRRSTTLAAFLELVGVFVSTKVPAAGGFEDYTKREVNWDQIPKLLDPSKVLEDLYAWGGTKLDSSLLLSRLDAVLWSLGIPCKYRDGTLALLWRLTFGSVNVPLGVEMQGLPASGAEPAGLSLVPTGLASVESEIQVPGGYALAIKANASASSGYCVNFRPSSVRLAPLAGLPAVNWTLGGQLTVSRHAAAVDATVLFGAPGGTRLEAKEVAVSASVEAASGDGDAGLAAMITGGRVVIMPGEDSFLSKILPPDGVAVDFDFGIGWSSRRGLSLNGSAGIETTIPLDKQLGPLWIDSVFLRLALRPDGRLGATAAASMHAALGAAALTVERLGLELSIKLGRSPELDVSLVPPSSVGIAIDAEGVGGGGFLSIDSGNYAGILQIKVVDVTTVTVIGILTTRTPDGAKTFSLKLFGTAEFSPIQLGFGFSLTGVGLAVGIESALNDEALRKATYEGSLRSLLFPPDPVANAIRIIEDLKAFFPPKEGCFVIGAMAQLGWGAGTPLVKAEVGIFVEVSDSVRLMLAGVAYAILPNEESAILTLNIQLLGLLDFKKKTLAIDSSLHGSKLLDWALDGDVALRSCWGDRPRFAFCAGGFFPGYPPPANFPALDRISLTIGSGNPRIRLSSYLAVTENSVQLGAAVDFYWHKKYDDLPWPLPDVHIEADGGTGFDALVQFNPFYFDACMNGHFGLKCNGDNLMTVTMDMTLSGPNNYHFVGTFSFEVFDLGFDVTVDEWFGRKLPEVRPPPVDPATILLAELAKDENWSFIAADKRTCGVVFVGSSVDGGECLVDPFTTAGFEQKAMPLGLAIVKIGQVDAQDGSYDIKLKDAAKLAIEDVEESFALGNYLDLNDSEKLTCEPFERKKAGFQLGFESADLGATVSRALCFEDILLSKDGGSRSPVGAPRRIPANDWVINGCKRAGRELYTSRRSIAPRSSMRALRADAPRFQVRELGAQAGPAALRMAPEAEAPTAATKAAPAAALRVARRPEAPPRPVSFFQALVASRSQQAQGRRARIVSEAAAIVSEAWEK